MSAPHRLSLCVRVWQGSCSSGTFHGVEKRLISSPHQRADVQVATSVLLPTLSPTFHFIGSVEGGAVQ